MIVSVLPASPNTVSKYWSVKEDAVWNGDVAWWWNSALTESHRLQNKLSWILSVAVLKYHETATLK